WQITKIFQLSKSKKSESPQGVPDNRDNKIQGYITAIFGIFLYGFMIYNFWNYSKLYPPKSGSAEGVQIDNLFFTTIVVIMIVQVVTQFLLFYYGYKYHGKKGQVAKFIPENEKLE